MNEHTGLDDILDRAAATIRTTVLASQQNLTELRRRLEESRAAALTSPDRQDLWLADEILPFLQAQSLLIEGAGIAFAPGAFEGPPAVLDWWRRNSAGEIRYVHYDFNPRSIAYYDYPAHPWFRAAHDGPAITGPFIDAGGVNVNIVTLAGPVRTASGVHVVGCDMSLAALESTFVRSIGATRPALVLVSAGRRVLAANTAAYSVGARAPEPTRRTVPVFDDLDEIHPDWCVYAIGT